MQHGGTQRQLPGQAGNHDPQGHTPAKPATGPGQETQRQQAGGGLQL